MHASSIIGNWRGKMNRQAYNYQGTLSPVKIPDMLTVSSSTKQCIRGKNILSQHS